MKIVLISKEAHVHFEPKDLKLDDACPGTAGEGCLLGRNTAGQPCSTCDGRGVVVTPLGLHILEFVFKNAAWYRAREKKSHVQK